MSEALDNALAAMEAFNRNPSERDALVLAKCRGLVRGYDAAWRDSGYQPLAVEQVYTSDLYNPDTSKKSRTFTVAGKIDVLAELHGRTYIIDHKTTTENITDPDSDFWRVLTIEGQVSQYFLLMWLQGVKPDGAVWDAIRRPQIAPRQLTAGERGSVVSTGKWFGFPVDDVKRIEIANGDKRESLAMYEGRLANDCIVERPEWYFQRKPVPRLDSAILEYSQDLWELGQLIIASRRRTRLLKTPGACMAYNSPCKFLGICSGHDSPDSDRWKRKELKNPELNGVVGDVLTNSRARTFQLCQTKHHYEYELGIERQDDEEKESLYFGSLIHVGLESWWRTLLPNDDNHENDSETNPTAIGVAGHSAGEAELSSGN